MSEPSDSEYTDRIKCRSCGKFIGFGYLSDSLYKLTVRHVEYDYKQDKLYSSEMPIHFVHKGTARKLRLPLEKECFANSLKEDRNDYPRDQQQLHLPFPEL